MLPKLGPVLREATAKALGDIEPKHVAVMIMSFFAGDNASPMQIFAMASTSPARAEKLKGWAIELAKAWKAFAEQNGIEWGTEVDVWPIMPAGQWMMPTAEAISKMSE